MDKTPPSNLISYLFEQQKTFDEEPFNPVDSLILSSVCYLSFEHIDFADPHGKEKILLHDILALTDRKALIQGDWLEITPETKDFLLALMASRRYRDTKLAHYVHIKSEEIDEQFSAVTFFIPGISYLAFRGTDGSFAGWKEDFNLSFKDVIPSQTSAAEYLSELAPYIEGDLILGGHSKGGNLAEYAALTAEKKVFDQIQKVFNHDGPFFLNDPSPLIHSDEYARKLNKIVPGFSAIGMLFERRSDYAVVQSSASAIMQHHPFSWIVEGNDFLYQESLSSSAVFFDAALSAWLEKQDPSVRKQLIDTVFDLFASTDADNFLDLRENLFGNVRQILSESAKLDKETRDMFVSALSSLLPAIKDVAAGWTLRPKELEGGTEAQAYQ